MNPHAPARLIFDWAHDHRGRLALWILAAALLHAGAYFLLRVVHPPAVPLPALDATLYVLPADSPEAKRLAPFIASNDPSLFAPETIGPVSIPDPKVPDYQPDYAAAPPAIVPLPDPQTRLFPPIIRDIGPVPMPDGRANWNLPAPAEATQIELVSGLEGRKILSQPAARFAARPGDQLTPARFLVKVAADGRVLLVFQDDGSSNRDLDAAAAQLLHGMRFDAADADSWGAVVFHWGTDVTRREVR